MKAKRSGVRSKKGQTVFVVAVSLVALGVAGAVRLASRPTMLDGVERIGSDRFLGKPLALHKGYWYVWQEREQAVYRVPLKEGVASLFFRLPPGASDSRFEATDEGLYVIDYPSTASTTRSSGGGGGSGHAPSNFKGEFLLGPARPGEKRFVLPPGNDSYVLRVRRCHWHENALQTVPLPPKPQSLRFVGVNCSGMYLTRQTDGLGVEVRAGKSLRYEYAPDTTLLRVAFEGGTPAVLARDLTRLSQAVVSDDAVCWEKLRLYPDAQRDTVCQPVGAARVTLPNVQLWNAHTNVLVHDCMVDSESGNFWWLQSGGNDGRPPQMVEKVAGELKPRGIEPPLRHNEADTISYLWIRRSGDRLYALCTVRYAEETAVAPPGVEEHYLPPPGPEHLYLMRLTPSLAGQPGFWGKPASVPSDATNWLTDKQFLYFTRLEADKSFVLAVQDLLSSSTKGPTMHTVLYRVPLP